jgi:hypothetical protein
MTGADEGDIRAANEVRGQALFRLTVRSVDVVDVEVERMR